MLKNGFAGVVAVTSDVGFFVGFFVGGKKKAGYPSLKPDSWSP